MAPRSYVKHTRYSKPSAMARSYTQGISKRGAAAASRRASYSAARTLAALNQELKFHDVDVDDTVIAAGANVLNSGSVNQIAQGVTESTRVGRKAVIRSINWRWEAFMEQNPQAVGSTDSDVVRIILYLDRQANGATITNTDLLETADYQSFNNLSNKDRFRVLYDRTVPVNPQAAGGNGTTEDQSGVSVTGTCFLKCDIPVEFSSTTGAVSEIRSNNLGVMLCSKNGIAGFGSKLRLRFTD